MVETTGASVLLVDDFAPFRVYVRGLLRQNPQLRTIAEASDGSEAVEKARQLKPDVVVLDANLPKLHGFEAAQQIREVAPESKIIFVTQETSCVVVQAAIDLGALGYVVKTKIRLELLKAIELALKSEQFIGSGLVLR